MDKILRNQLIYKARQAIKNLDPAHDIYHTLRVLCNAEKISAIEGGDLDVITAGALFHDVVNYPKNHPKRLKSSFESAMYAKKVLTKEFSFSKSKVEQVFDAINVCSFSKGIVPISIESKILQDADLLESTGAISIMRTFSSGGTMGKPFFDEADPFCEKRKPDDLKYSIDLFYTRLFIVEQRLNTKTAKLMAKKRNKFLHDFLKQLRNEIY